MTLLFIQDKTVPFAKEYTRIVCVDDNGMQGNMSLQSSQNNLTKHDGYKSINSLPRFFKLYI